MNIVREISKKATEDFKEDYGTEVPEKLTNEFMKKIEEFIYKNS